jgi:VTC domain
VAIKKFQRFELKFVLNNQQFESFVKDIEPYVKPDKYCVGGARYPINTIYFDTPGRSVIRHSLSKPGFKEKFRLRSYYSSPKEDDTVFLEIKKKIKGCVSKRRAACSFAEAKRFLETKELEPSSDYMHNQVLKEIIRYLEVYDVSPTAYISYDRLAFFAKGDKELRLTFDNNILARDYDVSLGHGQYGTSLLEADKHLLEIKIHYAMPLWLAGLLSKNKIYKTSFSKYGNFHMYQVKSGADLTAERVLPC